MFGRKKKSLEYYDNNSSKTVFKGDLSINGVNIFRANDNNDHTVEVKDGQIIIDGEDRTQETVETLKESNEKIEDSYGKDGSIYFENLTIQVNQASEIEADAENVEVKTPQVPVTDNTDYNVKCHIVTSGDVNISGNCTGYIECNGDLHVNGHYSGHLEVDGDTTINGNLTVKDSGGRTSTTLDLSVDGCYNGEIETSGTVNIQRARSVSGKIDSEDEVNIEYREGAQIDINIDASGDVNLSAYND